jgi:2-keto-4-pentenoate hydratase/2-oxohepta-3-ene-1,7-dioic acid hydratase in catechol pathway
MRIARVDDRAVLLRGDGVTDIARGSGGRFGADPMAPFRSWPAFLDWAASVDHPDEPLADRTLQNPIPAPTQVFGVAANYRAHLLEAGAPEDAAPTEPLSFRVALSARPIRSRSRSRSRTPPSTGRSSWSW